MTDHQNTSAGSEGAIKQRFDGEEQRKDCFLCSAAMAAGVIYDEAWNALDDELRACFAADAKGPIGDQCDRVLAALGFERVRVGARTGDPTTAPGDYFVLFMLPEYATSGFLRNILWGRRALLQVPSKNYPGEQHIIYWDGRELHDPSNKRTWEWKEVEPIYVWLFDERRVIPTPAQSVQVTRQYYYRMNGCKAQDSESPDCICWHDEGTGPRSDETALIVNWREKPVASQPSPAATVETAPVSHVDLYACHHCAGTLHAHDPGCPVTRSSAGRESAADTEMYRLRDLIASHIACEADCQKMPTGCGCALTAARAVMNAVPQSVAWQPIETAPKDGTCVLITDFDGVEVVAFWQSGQWLVRWDHEHYESPTHWHALPSPLSRPQCPSESASGASTPVPLPHE